MSKAVFTMKIEADLRDAFMAEAEAAHRPASQLLRELIRDYIRQRQEQRYYDEYLQRKVDVARSQIAKGQHLSNEDVEAQFAAKRSTLQRTAGSRRK
jgi:predicted transcriptional regulator